jgi:hypothetical protein
VTSNQEKEILGLINELRMGYWQFFDENRLPIDKFAAGNLGGPRAELMAELIPEFQKVRNRLLSEFESKLMSVLDPDQGDQLLGRLIVASGPRSLVESPELRRRLKLTESQVIKLEKIFLEPADEWNEEMHRGDKLQDVTDPEVMREKMGEYSTLRRKLISERIWKVRKAMDDAEKVMDEQALLAITPEQKLVYDDLESKAPKLKK